MGLKLNILPSPSTDPKHPPLSSRRRLRHLLRSPAISAAKSLIQTLWRFIKKPWEITGPCADPEYRGAVPLAVEYRKFAPATPPAKAIIPTSDPDTVFDIKYYARDQRRNRPSIRHTILRKPDVERIMKEKTFDADSFPRVYLVKAVEEDENARGGGYQK